MRIRSILILILFLLVASSAQATDYYVRTDGSDSNDGSANDSGHAWLTIQHCADSISAGDTCCVDDGTYAGFAVEEGGTSAGAPKTFRAINIGSVNITSGASDHNNQAGISVQEWGSGHDPSYTTLNGFTVTNQTRYGIFVAGASYVIVKNCRVYDNTDDIGIHIASSPHASVLDCVAYGNGSTTLEHNLYVANGDSDYPTIRGNILYSAGGGSGLQLNGDWDDAPGEDGYIDYAVIEDNIIYSNAAKGMSLISIRYSTIKNNVVYNETSGAAGIHISWENNSHPPIDNIIVNNTIIENNIYALKFTGTGVTDNIAFNNIFVNSSGNYYIEESGASGNYLSNNYSVTSVGSNFVAAGSGDYHLATGSSAINYGAMTYQGQTAPTDDFDGTTRSSPDAGAFEYVDGDDFFYVSQYGAGSACTLSAPCQTIAAGISAMSTGDTVTVGDGNYSERISGSDIPSGTSGSYTRVRAQNRAQATIITDSVVSTNAVAAIGNNYIVFDGFRLDGNGYASGVAIISGDYIKVLHCAAFGAADTDNGAGFQAIEGSSYGLFEECWAWGMGARYKFQIFHADHWIVRRCVARHDYKDGGGTLHCALFNNYDSSYTVFQNNIAIDSDQTDGVVCGSSNQNMYGAWFFENKVDYYDTTTTMHGNIALNVSSQTYADGIFDKASGPRTVSNQIIYDQPSGFSGMQGEDDTASYTVTGVTAGAISGTYDSGNGKNAFGVGFQLRSDITNTVQNSIFFNNHDYGVADYVTSDYNIFYGNGTAAGGSLHTATVGAHSVTDHDPESYGLLYLPRVEAGSYLATACNGGPCGAQIMYKIGADETIYGEADYNATTTDDLWPFPNEALIKNDFASYDGSGPAGARGFCTGNSMDGNPQTLTKYIWEYLGSQIPADIYGAGSSTNLIRAAGVTLSGASIK